MSACESCNDRNIPCPPPEHQNLLWSGLYHSNQWLNHEDTSAAVQLITAAWAIKFFCGHYLNSALLLWVSGAIISTNHHTLVCIYSKRCRVPSCLKFNSDWPRLGLKKKKKDSFLLSLFCVQSAAVTVLFLFIFSASAMQLSRCNDCQTSHRRQMSGQML